MAQQKKKTNIKLVTPKFRASFAHVFEPKAINGGDKEFYSLAMLFDAKAQATPEYKAIVDGIKKIIKDDFGGKVPPRFWNPLQDGNSKEFEGYAGTKFMNAKSQMRPGLIDKEKQEILDKSEFYSGCYARATITLWPFDTMGNKGIGVGLQNIQKLAEGEPLNGRTKAQDDFDDAYDDEELDVEKEESSDDMEF